MKFGLNDRHDDQLRKPHADFQREWRVAAIPARDHELALIVGIDQAHKVAQYDAVFVAESGSWKDHRRKGGVADVYRKARSDQVGRPR